MLEKRSRSVATLLAITLLLFNDIPVLAQRDAQEMGMSMKQYIRENHIDRIEGIIHGLADSKPFIDQFLEEEQRHSVDVASIKRKDVKVGADIDIEVHHFSEHQTFTLFLVPISIYSIAVYDTLLFSVLEVTDEWLQREFPYEKIKNDSVRSSLLSMKNHDLLAEHLYERALKGVHTEVGQFKIQLQESYISTSTIHEHISSLDKDEKDEIRKHWGLLKKALSHSVDLNVEFNIYVFGFNDLQVQCKIKGEVNEFKITPGNIFTRHQFTD